MDFLSELVLAILEFLGLSPKTSTIHSVQIRASNTAKLMGKITLTTEEQVNLSLVFRTKRGAITIPPDGATFAWVSSDPAVVALTSTGTATTKAKATGVGSATVAFSLFVPGTAAAINASRVVEVVAAPVDSVDIVAGDPELQPLEPPVDPPAVDPIPAPAL